METMTKQAVAELAPTGVLRAGINMSNVFLVSGQSSSGDPQGVAPDMAAEIAARLGVPVAYVKFERPSLLAEAAGAGVWDVGLLAIEPARAEKIEFTPAYCELEAAYLVPANSPFRTPAEVDRPGARIASRRGSAYDLWLERNIKQAKVLRFDSVDAAVTAFVSEGFEALAGLRQHLLKTVTKVPGARILADNFTTVRQAVGTEKKNVAGAVFLRDFIADAKRSGLVGRLIEKHNAVGLSLVP